MKLQKFAYAGILSVSLLAFPSCKKSTESADAAKEVMESVKETTEGDLKEGAEETAEALDKTAEAVTKDVEEKIEDAEQGASGATKAEAQKLMDATYAATEQYAELMESIKDDESAKAALAKFDELGAKYEDIGKMAQALDKTAVPQDEAMEMQKAMMDKMVPLQERMQKSAVGAMEVLGKNPELMKEFQEKSMALAQKMMQMQQGQ